MNVTLCPGEEDGGLNTNGLSPKQGLKENQNLQGSIGNQSEILAPPPWIYVLRTECIRSMEHAGLSSGRRTDEITFPLQNLRKGGLVGIDGRRHGQSKVKAAKNRRHRCQTRRNEFLCKFRSD